VLVINVRGPEAARALITELLMLMNVNENIKIPNEVATPTVAAHKDTKIALNLLIQQHQNYIDLKFTGTHI